MDVEEQVQVVCKTLISEHSSFWCHGGKHNKDCVTVLLGANMDGSENAKPLELCKFKFP